MAIFYASAAFCRWKRPTILADFGLPRHHRDPFDRMLVAQAQVEGLPFVTGDKQIQKYPIQILW